MKKISLILMCVIMLFCLCGCGNKETSKKDTELSQIEKVLKEKGMKKTNWNCEISLNEIKEFGSYGNLFITNNNQLYEFSINQLYSNNENCKKIETELTFDRFLDYQIVDTNKNLYLYENGIFTNISQDHIHNINFYKYENIYNFQYGDYTMYMRIDEKNNLHIMDKSDIMKDTIIKTFSNDENILHISNSIIKTNKSFYEPTITNQEQCSKYIDIECEYGIKKDNLSEIYDYIYLYNKNFVIIKNQNEYELYSNR